MTEFPCEVVAGKDECDCVPADQRCGSFFDEDGGYVCTRPAGHTGDHVACVISSEMTGPHRVAAWPRGDDA